MLGSMPRVAQRGKIDFQGQAQKHKGMSCFQVDKTYTNT